MRQKLIYYYLYIEETLFPLNIYPHLFRFDFCCIVTNATFSHGKLPIMGQTGHGKIGRNHKGGR